MNYELLTHVDHSKQPKSYYEDENIIISFSHVEAIYKGTESAMIYTSSCTGDGSNSAFKVLDMKRFIEEYKEWKRFH